jgi:predicted enzyme related to lactoylglutathione lyase
MSERDGYDPGVPCWIDTWQPDADAPARFYAGLLGWETERTTPDGAEPQYVMCRLRGRDVAAIGSGGAAQGPPAWTTYIRVESVDATAANATAAGGAVVAAPFDSLDGGRVAILADPSGAPFGVWETGAHRGAQVINEPGAWAMSILLSDDPETAKAFYGAVLGWGADPFPLGDSEGLLWRLPGYVGGKAEQPVPRDVVGVLAPAFGRPGGWVVNFWVPDADETAARAVELGGAIVHGPFDSAISRDAVIADPAGAIFTVSTAPAA